MSESLIILITLLIVTWGINSLLDKYAEDGLLTIESTEVLKLDPLNKLGTPIEIIKAFGNKKIYLEAIKELEIQLYQTTA